MRRFVFIAAVLSYLMIAVGGHAGTFQLPTANKAILEEGKEKDYFAPTPGRTWTSGSFGCVRSQGFKFHEGADIKSMERDRRGEPIDPVMASADGRVVYVSSKAGNSSYGIYVVISHTIDRLEVFTLYAHLRALAQGLRPGREVKAGDVIGTLGRTATYSIARDRAHLHFEVGLIVSDRFDLWFKKNYKGTRNIHGKWNGQNLLGLDPAEVLQRSHFEPGFNLLTHVRNQKPLCKVMVRKHGFSWLQRYPMLVKRNEKAIKEGAAGFEVWLTYNGIPFTMIPRAPSEIGMKGEDYELLEVDGEIYKEGKCCKIVTKTTKGWVLSSKGERLLDMLTY